MPRTSNRAFSLIEMVLAMSIFAVMGFTLYGLFNSLTNTQSSSLGMQRFRNEALMILERMEDELKRAVCDEFYVYEPGIQIYSLPDYLPPAVTSKERIKTEFRCVNSSDAVALSVGAPDNPQLFYTIEAKDYDDATASIDEEFKEIFKKQSEELPVYNQNFLKERVIILRNIKNSLYLYGKNEKLSQSETNYLDGLADNNIATTGKHGFVSDIGSNIYHIEYRFWGPNSKSWDDDGTGPGNPIKTWGDDPSRPSDTLPLGMKIILVMVYNPDMYHSKSSLLDHNKDQYIIFEKVVIFKKGVPV